MLKLPRRRFLLSAGVASAATLCRSAFSEDNPTIPTKMSYGLVTYMWAANWDLPTLLGNCVKTNVLGVELRTTHKHGVEPSLTKDQRREVQKQFDDSGVTLVGLGSNENFDNPDPAVVKKAIERSKEFVVLSHDVGGTGVKVKPDSLHKNVPREKTIEQIGKSLNELGEFALGYGQQIRLEVHGGCAEPKTIAEIKQVADNENVFVCWNGNKQDLEGDGLEANFNLLRPRFGRTLHARPFDDKTYPYAELMKLLVASDYEGWVMLEDGNVPKDPVTELARQRKLFDEYIATSQK
jgi:sugar phosphate isomerase/epimerase